MKTLPRRVIERPDASQWAADEPITLKEAAGLFCPDGPLSLHSFRTAAHNGTLAIARCAGKYLTTPAAVRDFLKPRLTASASRQDDGRAAWSSSSSASELAANGKAAQAAALRHLRQQRERLAAMSKAKSA